MYVAAADEKAPLLVDAEWRHSRFRVTLRPHGSDDESAGEDQRDAIPRLRHIASRESSRPMKK
jgi:hypothetical protein